MGKSGYYCYGALARVRRLVPIRTPAGVGLTDVADLITLRDRWLAHREKAERKLATARRAEARTRTRVKRLQTALRSWQAKVRRWERLAAMTDVQVQAVWDRAKHATHVRKVRRRLLGRPAAAAAPPA